MEKSLGCDPNSLGHVPWTSQCGGFSLNKQVMVKKESVVAQRVIVDSIRAAGGIEKVAITKELQMSTSRAQQRYVAYLDDKKKTT